MQISVESVNSIKKKLNFEIPAEKVSAEVDKAYAEIRKHAAIKGFRKGKVPMSLIEKHYGEKMADDVVKSLVSDTYFQAVTEKGLNPVSYPVIESEMLQKGQPFKYSATIEVFPEVELKEYLGLEVQKEKLELDPAAVDARLKEMQERMAQLAPAPEGRAAAMGDFVTFDFEGSIDGVPFDGGAAEDFQLEIGSGRFIPGFEDQLVGMTVGTNSTIKVTFPENYGSAELAGKPADFEITVKEIKIKELPELNDDFAKEFGEEFETLDLLKAKLAEINQAQEESRINHDLRENVFKALIEKNPVEVPEALVDRQVTMMLENTKQRLASQRMSLEMMGMTDDSYKAQFRDAARDQVKGSVIVDAVAEKESVVVTEEEFEGQIAQISAQTGQPLEKVAQMYKTNERAKDSLMAQMREDKAVQFIIERAKVTEVPKAESK
ncbi:trigger factor [Geomonas subterranea]|uniref:Trigger factor n=1 Tax=Geomonas subterranea TaxID=2847989 RepID=A0ABX8LH90_9BACT|nr:MULTISPECIES: trigger factor [Geomonas]QXE91108.1 trigger factor [Geomonas subterranea]QXM10805.1 trigger factor [Geomonas subterranea]